MTDHDDMATPKDIDPGIMEREERATEGPWWVESCAGLVFVRTTGDRPIDEFHDKLFIAHARTDIPALLEDRDRLVAWIGRLQERVRELEAEVQNRVDEKRDILLNYEDAFREMEAEAIEARAEVERLQAQVDEWREEWGEDETERQPS